MVRVSSPAKLRPWSELTAKMVMGVGSWVGHNSCSQAISEKERKRAQKSAKSASS